MEARNYSVILKKWVSFVLHLLSFSFHFIHFYNKVLILILLNCLWMTVLFSSQFSRKCSLIILKITVNTGLKFKECPYYRPFV